MLACHLLRSFFFLPFSRGGALRALWPGGVSQGAREFPGASLGDPVGRGASPLPWVKYPAMFVFFPLRFSFFFLFSSFLSSPQKGRLLLGALPRGVSQGAPGSTRIDGEPGGSQWPGGESPTLGEIPGHVCVFY